MDWNRIKNHDWIITTIISVLIIIGCVMIFSSTYNTETKLLGAGSLPKQIIFIFIGFFIYFGLIFSDIDWLKQKTIVITLYIITIILLLYLKFAGVEIAETNRWIDLGIINFQPSEYAKIVLIILSSFMISHSTQKVQNTLIKWEKKNEIKSNWVFSKQINNIYKKIINNSQTIKYFSTLILIGIVVYLVFIQPALGNAIILLLIPLIIIFTSFRNQSHLLLFFLISFLISISIYRFISLNPIYESLGVFPVYRNIDVFIIIISFIISVISIRFLKFNIKYLFISILIGIIIFPIINWGWNNALADYQKDRIEIFMQGPEIDPYGAGFQITQSKIALGSGRLSGRGFLQGSQSSLKVLDFTYTDFIFASLSEQFGFIGSFFVLLLYFILIIRIFLLSQQANIKYYSLIIIGVGAMILLNVFINIGMNMGLLPVTGVPLPFVSYGGSSILVNMIGLGLVQSIIVSKSSTDISEKILL